jgi:hydrogenase expression/formation protein HypC
MCLAIPGKVLTIEGEDPNFRSARVTFGGVERAVNLAFTPEAQVGDYVLVHVGFSLSVIDEAEALKNLATLEQLQELGDEAS